MQFLLFVAVCLTQAREPRPITMTDTPEWMAREGVADSVEPWEDGMRHDPGRGNFEWWYFDAHFDDGSTAVVNFLTKRIMKRKRGLAPKLEITLTPPDGEPQQDWTFLDPDTFTASDERCDVTMGNSWVRGDLETYTLHVEGERLVADLTFTRAIPSWRPGSGKVYLDDDATEYFGWVVPVPFGTVTGTLTWEDGRVQEVSGHGYHDHNWGNVDLAKVFDNWLWGRTHSDGYSVLFFHGRGSKKWGRARLPLLMLANEDELLTDNGRALSVTAGLPVAPDRRRERIWPGALDFDVDDTPRLHLVLREPQVLERQDLLDVLPRLLRGPVRGFQNPWYYRFDADYVMYLDWTERVDRVEGHAIYELMLFR